MGDDTELTAAPIFKKKAKKTSQQNTRKRTIDADASIPSHHEGEQQSEQLTRPSKPDGSHQEPVVKFHRRKSRTSCNPLCQATGTSSKRMKTGDDQSSSDEADESDTNDDQKAVGVSYKAQGSARQQVEENLQKSILEMKQPKILEPPDSDDDDRDQTSSKVYLGQAKSKYQLPKGSMKYGPIKGGPTNIQTITVVDYQPDVCKDYKETGYCGFGDTCKFLHDRGDYMHGWQLDDAFNSRNKKAEVESEEEEEVPFACLICRQPFTDPVVTKCRHYYCSSCAIKRFAKTPKCFACGAPTGGIFNKASRVIEKMKLKQERIKRQKEERRIEAEGLTGIEGLEEQAGEGNGDEEQEGSERSFYEDE